MRKLLYIAATILLSGIWVSQVQAADRLTVVELFTSQGCSSCPPADSYLKDLTKNANVLPLSFNVDYWDYLGWPDTFGSPDNTKRQRGYARAFRSRQIYTPQMVIDGRYQAVGSDRRGVSKAIARSQAINVPRLNIDINEQKKDVLIRISGNADIGENSGATIWLVTYKKSESVKIRRGENTGRTIAYHNIVRKYHSLGMWRGKDMEIAIMRDELATDGTDACAIIVQAGMHGPVVGAAKMDFH